MRLSRRMFASLAVAAIVQLASSTVAHAHGTAHHLMGTAKTVAVDHLEVATPAGKVVDVRVTDATKFLKDDKPAKPSDLKPGDRVVIDLSGEGEPAVATEVNFAGK